MEEKEIFTKLTARVPTTNVLEENPSKLGVKCLWIFLAIELVKLIAEKNFRAKFEFLLI